MNQRPHFLLEICKKEWCCLTMGNETFYGDGHTSSSSGVNAAINYQHINSHFMVAIASLNSLLKAWLLSSLNLAQLTFSLKLGSSNLFFLGRRGWGQRGGR